MSAARIAGRRQRGLLLGVAVTALVFSGCTRESVRTALETQRRADDVEEAVVQRQHEALCVLLYRDSLRRLAERGVVLDDAQRAALSAVWSDRDLIEFWAVQHERAKALRIAGVDAKLAADQSIVDLLWKQLAARAGRIEQGLAAQAADAAASALPPRKE